eukprot:947883-Pelagomonas_calceolata.AAC.4
MPVNKNVRTHVRVFAYAIKDYKGSQEYQAGKVWGKRRENVGSCMFTKQTGKKSNCTARLGSNVRDARDASTQSSCTACICKGRLQRTQKGCASTQSSCTAHLQGKLARDAPRSCSADDACSSCIEQMIPKAAALYACEGCLSLPLTHPHQLQGKEATDYHACKREEKGGEGLSAA